MKRIIRKILKMDNKGNSMFETIVAFLVLSILFLLVLKMIVFCGELRMRATDTALVISEFNENMYKTTIPSDKIESVKKETIPGIEGGGPLFYLLISDETKQANLKQGNVSDYLEDDVYENYRLRLDNIKCNSLKSKDSRIADEKLITPKAVQFYYER